MTSVALASPPMHPYCQRYGCTFADGCPDGCRLLADDEAEGPPTTLEPECAQDEWDGTDAEPAD